MSNNSPILLTLIIAALSVPGRCHSQSVNSVPSRLSNVRTIAVCSGAVMLTSGRVIYPEFGGKSPKTVKLPSEPLADIARLISTAAPEALERRLSKFDHLTVVHISQSLSGNDHIQSAFEGVKVQYAADALASLEIVDFGVVASIERGIWILGRLSFKTASNPDIAYVSGYAFVKSGFQLIAPKAHQSNIVLVHRACVQLAERLAHALFKGRDLPFAHLGKFAVLPAILPASVQKVVHGASHPDLGSTTIETLPMLSLARHADVLFQPEIWPGWQQIRGADILSEMGRQGVTSTHLWQSASAKEFSNWIILCQILEVDYLFASRFVDVEFEAEPRVIKNGDVDIVGEDKRVTARVEGILYGLREKRIIWTDITEGGTLQRMEYVRNKLRVRRDESTVLDAIRTSYAYLRYSFDEYCKQLDR